MSLKLPGLRSEVVYALCTLADPAYQEAIWINHKSPKGYTKASYYDSFDLAVQVIFDDARLSKDAMSGIGDILNTAEEARAIEDVVYAINDVFSDVGKKASDLQYVRSARWPRVVQAAQKALKILNETVTLPSFE